jgi:hypothetical protein
VAARTTSGDDAFYAANGYVGSFTKTLSHEATEGHLGNPGDYEQMRDAILSGDVQLLSEVPLHKHSKIQLVNPLASKTAEIVGKPSEYFIDKIKPSPSMRSKQAAAEMVELYSKALSRDVAFIDFSTDAVISDLLSSAKMNHPEVVEELKGALLENGLFSHKTIFRGAFYGENYGPMISQFFYQEASANSLVTTQQYLVPNSRASSGSRVEWGVNNTEVIDIQNGRLDLLPPPTDPSDKERRYINNGRTLAEVVHADPPYHFYYQAALLLLGLKCPPNVQFPRYANQSNFVTNAGGPDVLASIASVSRYALEHAWFFKWCQFRRLRPEVFGLWVDNVKNNRVNNNVYALSDLILDHPVLGDIRDLHQNQYGESDSYTLNQCFREGSPAHPSYPAGHAVIAGACCTVLKIYFDCEQKWFQLDSDVKQADATGANLVDYAESDKNLLTINGEINKLGSNVSLGRDWAGVHYRSDGYEGMLLGEQIAIEYMTDILKTQVETNLDGTPKEIVFRKFNGKYHIIRLE